MNEDFFVYEDQLSVEAIVARNMGDPDWEDLANETPRWRIGGSIAKTSERETLTWSPTERALRSEQ
jgi:hypothetical protein